jgi:hypothetical protein
VSDVEARRRMGAAARADAVGRYSLAHYAPVWLHALGAPAPASVPVPEPVR